MTITRRATVSVTLACDNRCVFCGQLGLPDAPSRARDDVANDLRAARETSDELTFVGGEPLLHPQLESVIDDARAMGFRAIGLQTNGRTFQGERAQRLAAAGLTDLHLSIHGHTAAAHDYHTDVAGSFEAAFAALAAARAASLTVVATTVLTRSNARGLGDLARVLARRGAAAWSIAVPRVRGRAASLFDRVVPRLGVAMPFALHAVMVAQSLGLPTFLRGAPLCVVGPFARYALPEDDRAYHQRCSSCAARSGCPGVEREYLDRFIGDELSPVSAVARTIDARFARMFVGEGAVAPPCDEQLPLAPARARVALPMLGKVQPARAEVPRTAEKKSGAALRELFKDLYKDGHEEGTTK